MVIDFKQIFCTTRAKKKKTESKFENKCACVMIDMCTFRSTQWN